MAFRIETAIGILAAIAALSPAADLEFKARHDHLRKGGDGTLAFSDEGLKWTENGKKAAHSRVWKYGDIQRLELEPQRVRITTYDDIGWQFGRDRVYEFSRLPDAAAIRLYPLLAARMDQRFVAHMPGPETAPVYETGAKLIHGRSGANGTLTIGNDRIVFKGTRDSRTWRFSDLASVSSSSPFELTLNTIEGENRFQLKQRLPEEQYQDLWRRIATVNSLEIYRSTLESHHENR
jgi:hypothetical protein